MAFKNQRGTLSILYFTSIRDHRHRLLHLPIAVEHCRQILQHLLFDISELRSHLSFIAKAI